MQSADIAANSHWGIATIFMQTKTGGKTSPQPNCLFKNEYFPESIFRKNTTTEILIVAEESKDETTCTTINPILRNTKMIKNE